MSHSLSEYVGFVKDALFLRPAEQFTPENTLLGEYTFLPWVRSGIAASVAASDGDIRARVNVSLMVESETRSVPVEQTLVVRGPGDVRSFDQRQIVRRYPAPDTVDAEPNFLAHVEFDRPDFPWIFTPRRANGDRLDPWLALVVVEMSAYTPHAPVGGRTASFTTKLGQLQPLEDGWAWAHAQISESTGENSPPDGWINARLSPSFGPINLSRLICPRKLDENTSYVACVVPTFDAGLKIALGKESPGSLAPAWTRAADGSDADDEIELPAFDSWIFHTGPHGDFEALAERLVPKAAPEEVGRRTLDTLKPGGGMDDLPSNTEGGIQIVFGPLYSPANATPTTAPWTDTVTAELRDILNRPDRLAGKPPEVDPNRQGPADEEEIPRPPIGPELYARYHAGRSRLEAELALDGPGAEWFHQLNARPGNRVVAGLGTRVVQMDQEELMQAAWAQVGAIDDANRMIRYAQLGRFAADSICRSLERLEIGDFIQLTRRLHSRIQAGDDLTVWGDIAKSSLPASVAGTALRRVVRQRGPIGRFATTEDAIARLTHLVGVDGETRDFQIGYEDLDGVGRLSERAASLFNPAQVATELGLDQTEPSITIQHIVSKAASLAQASPLEAITEETIGQLVTSDTFRPADFAAERAMEAISSAIPSNLATGVAQTLSNLGLMRAVAQTDTTVAVPARDRIDAIVTHIGSSQHVDEVARRAEDQVAISLEQVRQAERTRIELEQNSLQGSVEFELARAAETVARDRFNAATTFSREVSAFSQTTRTFETARENPAVQLTPADETRINARFVEGVAQAAPVLSPAALRLSAIITQTRDVPDESLGIGLRDIVADVVHPDWPTRTTRTAPALKKDAVLAKIKPGRTVTQRILAKLGDRQPDWMPVPWGEWFADERVQPIMAAPVFRRAMYQALDAYDRNWLIPGLDRMKEPDLVTLLMTNANFIEAFMVGLSHEMGRELLWRSYPTEQRGTYFRRFFNRNVDELAKNIHEFEPTPLGSHLVPTMDGRVVFLVRGELIRRYPDAIAMMVQQAGVDGENRPTFDADRARQLFFAPLEPDILLVGFDITRGKILAASNGNAWWFILAEHPAAPRFGLDAGPQDGGLTRDELDWSDLPLRFGNGAPAFLNPSEARTIDDADNPPTPKEWSSHAGTIAHLLLQSPVRAAFRADELIKKIEGVS